MSRLEARELGKSYSGRKVIESVSLHVDSGEVVGLLGPNGAGKTTCFYMIVGLVPSDGGSVWLDDQDLTPFPMHIRARKGVGYLPQTQRGRQPARRAGTAKRFKSPGTCR